MLYPWVNEDDASPLRENIKNAKHRVETNLPACDYNLCALEFDKQHCMLLKKFISLAPLIKIRRLKLTFQ